MTLNHCRCGNRPEVILLTTGLVRITCVLGKCDEIVCARADLAAQAWNEVNPADELPTKPEHEIPTAVEVEIPEDWSNA